ncbi:MAG: NAD(P)(+) transhydrogenase (Re/Si-specific) subunit alpha, partial [Actinomycetales bacterium]
MRLLVPAETMPGERRVAMVPSVIGKLRQLGFEVVVESGAGRAAYAEDAAYVEAGATIVPSDGL